MSSRKTATRRGTTKKRAQRATSNVFAMFNQDQIQEFKEAFNMIDHNRSGAGKGTPKFIYVNIKSLPYSTILLYCYTFLFR
jgi:hypothetical protein